MHTSPRYFWLSSSQNGLALLLGRRDRWLIKGVKQAISGTCLVRNNTAAATAMSAKIIDGKAIASRIRQRLKDEIIETQQSNPCYKPCLTIIQVGDRADSSTYVRMKLKAAAEAGITCNREHYPEDVSEAELLQHITRLNNDAATHGILMQLPLPPNISEHAITSSVSDEKDVDGFGIANVGELAKRAGRPNFVPCTPKGVMILLQETGIAIQGKHAVVLGRSDTVGSPTSYLLRNADATVTICHSRTKDIESFVKQADILVVAVGKPEFVKGHWLKNDVVVIDVGTNHIPDKSRSSGQKLVGDVEFESAVEVASHITPVPGGVGPMTVAMLLQNVVTAATSQDGKQK